MIELPVYLLVKFLHVAGAIIAVGSVTVTDSLLFLLHFKDRFAPVLDKISALMSMMVWTGFFILSVTGIYLVWNSPSIVRGTVFQIKIGLVTLVFLNGIILNEKVNPRFHDAAENWQNEEVRNHFERFAGVFAAISVIGWWSIIFLVYVVKNL